MENTPLEKPVKQNGSGKGRDTIFRVASRNQIELIAIADNKSNMIIGICVVLISLVIALIGSGFAVMGTPISSHLELLAPMCTMLVFAVSSAMFAILAAKPELIKDKTHGPHSLLFFQNIASKSAENYLSEMHTLLNDKNATYDQMIIEMYYNGRVLNRKYRLLKVAYLLFMLGLILTVVAFGVTMVV